MIPIAVTAKAFDAGRRHATGPRRQLQEPEKLLGLGVHRRAGLRLAWANWPTLKAFSEE
jgi:hypothetical protein